MSTPTPTPKRGRPLKHVGEKVITRGITLPPSAWAKLDTLRAAKTPSDWLFEHLKTL
jgi:hypothetical protein